MFWAGELGIPSTLFGLVVFASLHTISRIKTVGDQVLYLSEAAAVQAI